MIMNNDDNNNAILDFITLQYKKKWNGIYKIFLESI